MSDYNGWTNWETWQINLWIDNEEPTYRRKQSFLRSGIDLTGPTVKDLVLDIFPNGTPDFDDVRDFEKVNWDEIADYWLEERRELEPDSQS